VTEIRRGTDGASIVVLGNDTTVGSDDVTALRAAS